MHHNTTSLDHTRSRLVGRREAWCTTPPWSSYHLLLYCRSFSVKFNTCVLDIQVFIRNIYRPSLWVTNCNVSQILCGLLLLLYKIHKAQMVISNCMLQAAIICVKVKFCSQTCDVLSPRNNSHTIIISVICQVSVNPTHYFGTYVRS